MACVNATTRPKTATIRPFLIVLWVLRNLFIFTYISFRAGNVGVRMAPSRVVKKSPPEQYLATHQLHLPGALQERCGSKKVMPAPKTVAKVKSVRISLILFTSLSSLSVFYKSLP